MAQGEGFWFNPRDNSSVNVVRHELSLQDPDSQKILNFSPAGRSAVANLSAVEDEEKIKMVGVRTGLVRTRDWGKFLTIQFFANGNRRADILFALAELIRMYKEKDPDLKKLSKTTQDMAQNISRAWTLKIENIANNKSESVTPNILMQKALEDDFMEGVIMNDTIKDIHPTPKKLQEVDNLLRHHGYFQEAKEEDFNNVFTDKQITYSLDQRNSCLNEEKLSRVWQMTKNKGFLWGLISAQRGENDIQTNSNLMNQLKKDIRNHGYGFWELEGHWLEASDKQDERVDTKEAALFVGAPNNSDPDKFLNFMIDMTQKYNQDGSIYKNDPEADADIMLYQYKTMKNEKRVVDESHFPLGKLHPNKIGENYSKILGSGRTFIFESIVDTYIIPDCIEFDDKMIGFMTESELHTAYNRLQNEYCGSYSRSLIWSHSRKCIQKLLRERYSPCK